MRSILSSIVLGAAVLPFVTSVLSAAPARLITSLPVIKTGLPNTGPLIDPTASRGQWFQRPTGLQESRPYEFYDNILGQGGGAAGSSAIKGSIVNLQFAAGPGSALVGFDIRATITNDLPGQGFGQPGRNSHGEILDQTAPNTLVTTMRDVKLTAEFSFPKNLNAATIQHIQNNEAPYSKPNAAIQAANEDQLAWYCYTPIAGATGGDYVVPTWDFGDIAVGASASRTLSFVTSIAPSAAAYSKLLSAAGNQADVLLNRTTDLKIGEWIDDLAIDNGGAYPNPPMSAGNVSVFFNVPEPTTLALAGGVSVLATRRRRS